MSFDDFDPDETLEIIEESDDEEGEETQSVDFFTWPPIQGS